MSTSGHKDVANVSSDETVVSKPKKPTNRKHYTTRKKESQTGQVKATKPAKFKVTIELDEQTFSLLHTISRRTRFSKEATVKLALIEYLKIKAGIEFEHFNDFKF